MVDQKLFDKLSLTLDLIKAAGVADARVEIDAGRVFQCKTQNGVVDLLKESHSQVVSMRLFNNGHSGGFSTGDLRPDALKSFIEKAAEMVSLTDVNPAYSLPPKERIAPMPTADLAIFDPELLASKKGTAQDICAQITAGARAEAPDLIMVDAFFTEVHSVNVMATTQGFNGSQESTYLDLSTEVNVADVGGKKQNGWDGATFFKYRDMFNPNNLGKKAARRALDMVGAKPIKTDNYPIIIDKEAGSKLINWLLQALSGSNLYRNMSCLKDKKDQQIAPAIFTMVDNPLAPGGMASSYYDAEGMVNEPRSIIDDGVLKNFYISNYWANKMSCRPTTGDATNLFFKLGDKSGEEMALSAGKAIYITGFLGGNFNSLTGDFSTGIRGFLYEGGHRVAPISEMNLSGNLLDVLGKLIAMGNDPCPYEAIRCPAMSFDPLMVAGI